MTAAATFATTIDIDPSRRIAGNLPLFLSPDQPLNRPLYLPTSTYLHPTSTYLHLPTYGTPKIHKSPVTKTFPVKVLQSLLGKKRGITESPQLSSSLALSSGLSPKSTPTDIFEQYRPTYPTLSESQERKFIRRPTRFYGSKRSQAHIL
jgi:hypothetical protein